MQETDAMPAAPKQSVPYVLGPGEGRCFNVAHQLITVLAEAHDTAGGFGAVVCDATYDHQAIPLHHHAKEHDTWFCTRGRVQVWTGQQSRVLTAGDFCYVPPGDVHAYQSVAPRSQFFGVIAPGGWEKFFEESGEVWSRPGLPPENHPFDFSRMGRSMGKFGVMRAQGATYAEAANGDATDRALPAARASYVLQGGYGGRSRLNGHLSTRLLTRELSAGTLDMRTIEAGRGARMPMLRHAGTSVLLYLIDGTVGLTIDGREHVLTTGSCANLPAGVTYGTRVDSREARWLLTAAHGAGLSFWDDLGTPAQPFTFSDDGDLGACEAALRSHTSGDVEIVS